MTQVLVTGGAGYVGSHACKALACAGYVPVVYDNLERGHEWAVRWGPLERGDLLDPARLHAVFRTYDFSGVMHFAAYAYVGESMAEPAKYFRNNVVGSLNLLETMRAHDVDKIVFSSTCAVYGLADGIPITEDCPLAPVNPYGASKASIEQMLRGFDYAHELRSVSLRYFNAAGADPEGEVGEAHDPETHAAPLAILASLCRAPTFQVFGTDYPTPDGTAIRDYIHVADLASAHVAALDYLRSGGRSDSFNLGTGAGSSVFELLAAVERVLARPVPRTKGPRRPGDPPILVARTERARRVLNWQPRFTSIDEIIGTAARWHVRTAPV